MPAISYAPDRHSLSEGSWWWTKSQISLKTSSPNIRSGRKTRRIGDHSTQFGRCILQRIHFTDYIEITTAVVVPCGVPKSLLIHRYSFVIFTLVHYLSWTGSILTSGKTPFRWDLVMKNNSTTILSLPLIQEGQLSVTGERMGNKYW